MRTLIAIHVAACWYMTGVIWVIQSLHYPSFTLVPADQFKAFHARHTSIMTFVAGPAMLIELGTGAWLAWRDGGWWFLDLTAVGTLFASTFLVSVPLHDRLADGADSAVATRLTRTNWPRTILWTARGAVFLALASGWGDL